MRSDVLCDIIEGMQTTEAYVLRLPRSLKRDLSDLANAEGVSLNKLINLLLANAAGRSREGTLWTEVRHEKG